MSPCYNPARATRPRWFTSIETRSGANTTRFSCSPSNSGTTRAQLYRRPISRCWGSTIYDPDFKESLSKDLHDGRPDPEPGVLVLRIADASTRPRRTPGLRTRVGDRSASPEFLGLCPVCWRLGVTPSWPSHAEAEMKVQLMDRADQFPCRRDRQARRRDGDEPGGAVAVGRR